MLPQGFAFDERHHEIHHAVGLTGVMEWKDVGVDQPGCDLDLLQEPVGSCSQSELRIQNLHCHVSAVFEIPSEIDGSHSTTADFSFDGVPISKSGPQTVHLLHHGISNGGGSPFLSCQPTATRMWCG